MTEVIPLKDEIYRITVDSPDLIGEIKRNAENDETILFYQEVAGELTMIVDMSQTEREVLSYIH